MEDAMHPQRSPTSDEKILPTSNSKAIEITSSGESIITAPDSNTLTAINRAPEGALTDQLDL
ncbi:MAG: hypothetical protein Q9180_004777, partial [Flavoplaca navasiana]